jgi:hypothetical protein
LPPTGCALKPEGLSMRPLLSFNDLERLRIVVPRSVETVMEDKARKGLFYCLLTIACRLEYFHLP